LVNENIVLDYYLQLIADDEVEFLVGRESSKTAIIGCITALKEADAIHQKIEVAKKLWKLLFEASMSFIDKDKHGYDGLFSYFDEFVDFEELIFASDSFYRDHTIHCLWVYFLGEYLYRHEEFSFFFQDMMEDYKRAASIIKQFINVDLLDKEGTVAGVVESFAQQDKCQGAIRCVTALAHDLGYPLKKIQKINKSIATVLPHFSIENYQEFKFTYSTSQLPFIEKFLEFISMDFSITLFKSYPRKYKELFNSLITYDTETEEVNIQKEEMATLSEDELEALQATMSPQMSILKGLPRYLRYADDFEQQRHGILSAFLLAKKLWFFRTIPFSYILSDRLTIEHVDFHRVNAGITILSAIADHTSEGFKISKINTPAALLTIVDELEEFSRISRANQNRQYINQFCKTDLYAQEDWLCIDFIFDNQEIENLNPEIAFRGRCKRFLSLFDIPDLDDSIKIRLRCIGKLPANNNEYMLEISKNYANITVNGVEQNIPEYLKSRHFYARDEFGGGV
jgi:hypothetical protein